MEKLRRAILIIVGIVLMSIGIRITYEEFKKPEADIIAELHAEIVELINENIQMHSEAEYVAVYLYERGLTKQYLFYESHPIRVPEKLIIVKPVDKLLDFHSENTCYTHRLDRLPESKLKTILKEKFPNSEERIYLSCPIFGNERALGYVEMVYDPQPNRNGVIIEQNFMRYMANTIGQIIADELKI